MKLAFSSKNYVMYTFGLSGYCNYLNALRGPEKLFICFLVCFNSHGIFCLVSFTYVNCQQPVFFLTLTVQCSWMFERAVAELVELACGSAGFRVWLSISFSVSLSKMNLMWCFGHCSQVYLDMPVYLPWRPVSNAVMFLLYCKLPCQSYSYP